MSLKTDSPSTLSSGLLDPRAAAAYLQLSPQTLANWRLSGRGPKYVKLGSRVRYKQSALDQFIADGERQHTSEVEG